MDIITYFIASIRPFCETLLKDFEFIFVLMYTSHEQIQSIRVKDYNIPDPLHHP